MVRGLVPYESALRIAIDNLLEGVQVLGFDWTYLYLNETAARQGQRPVGELLGRSIMTCYPGIEQTPVFKALERVMTTRQSERLLNEFTYGNGAPRWFELSVEPVPDGICILSLDVTERHKAEQQLHHAQKMEALGQLAAGVAHDFNNVLTAILGYAELIFDQIGPDKPLGRDLEQIVAAAERATALTRQLLAFGRKQGLAPEPLAMNEVIARVEPMLRRVISENIAVRTSLDPETYPVLADSTQLEQVLLNLAVNARDAMLDGGVLTIATRNATFDDEYLRRHLGVRSGDYAVLSVTDTGTGMTPEVLARVFEPFFTTKEPGRGSGLGLAVVHGIVKQMNGHVWVYSEPGHGTVFKIYLPKTDQPIPKPEPRKRTARPVGLETILLVEDEPGVRSFARTVLQRHGYEVIEAGSAEEALARVATVRGDVHLVLTDVMLPGIDGIRLVHRIGTREFRPGVLFMSGYAELRAEPLPYGAALLEKPFTAHALLSRVRDVLGHPDDADVNHH